MTALLIVLSASLATWLLRIVFITVLPAERLPARVQRAFDDVAPAVLAAIVVSHLVRAGASGEIPWQTLGAVLAAAAVAWRSRNLALPVVVGVAVFGLLLAAPDLARPAHAQVDERVRPEEPSRAEGPSRPVASRHRADTVLWAQAAAARITRESLAAPAGVAEASRFLAPDVVVDDRAWTGSVYEGRAAWQEHLVGAYQLTLDELHLQRLFLDPRGALVQQRQDYLAGFGRPASVVQVREYGPAGVEHLRTSVAIRDLQRRPGTGAHPDHVALEELADRYVRAWSGAEDGDAVAALYAVGAELRDEVAGVTITGRAHIGRAAAGVVVDDAGARVLQLLPGSEDPAIYLDARTPSAISSMVLVHGPAAGARCPGTVAVRLELADGLIARERRFHDPRSARRCLDDLPDGWWTSVAPLEPADVQTWTLQMDGSGVPVLNSVPELDRLLEWALDRFETAGLGAPAIGSITFAGGSGRCDGLAGSVDTDADRARMLLCLDRGSACVGADCTSFTTFARSTVLHEFAHAWEPARLDAPTRRAFLALRGLTVWEGVRDVPWAERGAEQAAEIIMWGLLEAPVPLPRLDRPACEDLLASYQVLTGRPPLHGGCPDPATSAAGS
jgi:branched-subunit amino acid transport protein